jgi:bacterioferritin
MCALSIRSNEKTIVELLNEALKLEYGLIVHYPRIASRVQNHQAKELLEQLGIASVRHADAVAGAVSSLGGTPNWSFEQINHDLDMMTLLQIQLGKEKKALDLHQKAAGMVADGTLRSEFRRMAAEELNHIQTVERLIRLLS